MEGTATTCPTFEAGRALACIDDRQAVPFSQQWVTIARQEHSDLKWRASYWEAQHARLKSQLEEVRQDNLIKDAKIKDLQNRLFGKKKREGPPAEIGKGRPGRQPVET